MKALNLVLTVLVAFAVAAGAVFFLAPRDGGSSLGGASGQFHTNLEFFGAGLVDGGAVYATTTTAATETLTSAVLEKHKVIRFLGSATAAAITATLPASTTFPLPTSGDSRTWIIENGYTAAATTTTIAAGTGVDLQIPETTGADAVININGYGFLTCFREASSDVVCRLDETIVGD